jgi:hypothetical protein
MFCLILGVVMLCAGIVLIFFGYHGLLFLLLGSVSLVSVLQRKTS